MGVNAAKQEIQALWSTASGVFQHTAGDTYRIYINANKPNAEFTEVLSGASDVEEIAEAINAFSALSGPVSVTQPIANAEILITFAEIDGDVPQLTVVDVGSNTDTRTIVTLVEGWSFFAGESARLSHVQPGSIINVTASEEVTFTIVGSGTSNAWTSGNAVFSYDGTLASAQLAIGSVGTPANIDTAVDAILDEKGAQMIDVTCSSSSASSIVVTMPKGADGSKLELLPASGSDITSITKSVAKNNNGKSFKVKRVINKNFALDSDIDGSSDASNLVFDKNNVGAVVKGDELRFTRANAAGGICPVQTSVVDDSATDANHNYNQVIYKTVTARAQTATTLTLTYAAGGAKTSTACENAVVRTTIVVDSVPDTLDRVAADLHIASPIGSCTVTEAVKGTYESDVCSSRGSCDS